MTPREALRKAAKECANCLPVTDDASHVTLICVEWKWYRVILTIKAVEE